MSELAKGRHLKIRKTDLFREQAILGSLTDQIRDDIIYILERQQFDDDDREILALNEHGIKVLTGRVRNDIDRLRRTLTIILRLLPKAVE